MVKKKPRSRATRQSAAKDSLDSTPNDSSETEPLTIISPKVQNSVSAKVCRLCETRDGPFLNIFEADNHIAKKIEDVMPFMIEESDDLPHKICFRCSAKLEELFEFLQKCIKTQESLRTAMGKTGPLVMKSKGKALWEEKVKKTNLSNDDICDALIKRAIEGIKDRPPTSPTPPEEELPPPKLPKKTKTPVKKESTTESSDGEQDEITLKQVKLSVDKCDDKPPLRTLRTKKTEPLVDGIATVYPKKTRSQRKSEVTETKSEQSVTLEDVKKSNNRSFVTSFSMDYFENESTSSEPPKIVSPPKVVEKTPEPPPKPFNIMDHVSTIKVNGVGILFQCKLCNRNFLKKDGVESHGCAKNNVPKFISQNNAPIPEPPRPPTVKYITMDKDFKKNMVNDSRKVERPLEQKVPEKPSPVNSVIVKQELVDPPKPKPKAGPASKMRKLVQNDPPADPKPTSVKNQPEFNSRPTPPSIAAPTVNFPTNPSMFSSYKLVPGPNNSFTLLEDRSQKQVPEPEKIVPQQQVRKRKVVNSEKTVPGREIQESIIDLEEDNENPVPQSQVVQRPKTQPYPVGLFQAMPHNSNVYPTQLTATPFVQAPFAQGYPQAVFQPNNQLQYGGIQVYNNNGPSVLPHAQSVLPHSQPGQSILLHQQSAQQVYSQSAQTVIPHPQSSQSVVPHPQSVQPILPHQQSNQLASTAPPTFTTPAMKKQSYTVVQTGNPSKLLISAKPQPVPEDVNKRKSNRKQLIEERNQQDFQFVNVEPGTRVTYDSMIQESQISTSSVGDNKTYTCNMCNEKFSREKKLLAHIQSHYNAMDEEDQKRSAPAPKKRGRKS